VEIPVLAPVLFALVDCQPLFSLLQGQQA
jgi:hypothetical protein